ncbi:MAG: tRNA epoxyqueuosine(34) reductase QueG [Balneolaceae bacterium]|nr:MAG: tRNA epoxyqueuosine(34) reductase QueG [Balneolaceae bacterium]
MVREKALELGFEAAGFSRAEKMDQEAQRLEDWLNKGHHGTMSWMENHFDKRIDPRKLVPGAKSVVSVICNYYNRGADEIQQQNPDSPKIAKYALGEDYHFVLKDKLYELFEYTSQINGGLEGRVFVDSAPVMDKAWATRSGLGWLGKNTNVLRKGMGSWFFIGEMIVDAVFDYDGPAADHCGSCTKCIDACPTDALYEPYKIDAAKCISYLTIELRDAIPEHFRENMENWMFGCDICQDVCPWNRRAPDTQIDRLMPSGELMGKSIDFWEEINLDLYRELFRRSAVKRTKFEGLKRNISFLKPNNF